MSEIQNGQIRRFTIIDLQEIAVVRLQREVICVVISCDVIAQMTNAIEKPTNILDKSVSRN